MHASVSAGDQTVRRMERRIDIPPMRYPIAEIIAFCVTPDESAARSSTQYGPRLSQLIIDAYKRTEQIVF